jgi:hypothetical protein
VSIFELAVVRMGTIYVDEDTINSQPISSATADYLHSLGLIGGCVPVTYGTSEPTSNVTELSAQEVYFFYLGEDCCCVDSISCYTKSCYAYKRSERVVRIEYYYNTASWLNVDICLKGNSQRLSAALKALSSCLLRSMHSWVISIINKSENIESLTTEFLYPSWYFLETLPLFLPITILLLELTSDCKSSMLLLYENYLGSDRTN